MFLSSESVHANFKKIWAYYKCDEENPNYEEKLLKATLKYNAMHI